MVERADYLLNSGAIGKRLGRKYGVTPDIHVDDYVFADIYARSGQNLEASLDAYLDRGKVDAEKIRDLIADLQGAKISEGKLLESMALLDFASGYGCVARHFKNVAPNGKVVAIDIHDKAMYFNIAHLGIQAAVSDMDPLQVNPFFQFDVVFCLSFFSHQPRHRIGPWLDMLTRFVKVGGILLFTAHGATTHRDHLAHLRPDADGYAFEKASEQKDLSLDDYGNAITYPKFMFREINQIPGIELVLFHSAAWRTHQDLYVLRKIT